MLVVQFVFIGVGPRTVGRLHAQRVALLSSGPVVFATRVLGPLPQLLIVVGNILTPGRGFSEGDRKSTRLNSSHANISYAVFCLKKKDCCSERPRARGSTGTRLPQG